MLHLQILLPLFDFPEAGPWLHYLATFWACVGSIGVLGSLASLGRKLLTSRLPPLSFGREPL